MTDVAAGMAFIAWNKAVSVFPSSTFIRRRAFTTQSKFMFHKEMWIWAKKLADNGFDVVGEGENSNAACRDTQPQKRQVGDHLTWVLDLDTQSRLLFNSEPIPIAVNHPKDMNLKTRVNCVTSDVISFEVLHWTSQITQPGAFLRICEPFNWRQVSLSYIASLTDSWCTFHSSEAFYRGRLPRNFGSPFNNLFLSGSQWDDEV